MSAQENGGVREGSAQRPEAPHHEALLALARRQFHRDLLEQAILSIDPRGVASNADSGSRSSREYAARIASQLKVETGLRRLPGQTSGGGFEQACATFLEATFPRMQHIRPGEWRIRKVGGRAEGAGAHEFAQYAHLSALAEAIKQSPSLRTVLGNGYAIAPDVVVGRLPMSDESINTRVPLVDDSVAIHSSIRRRFQPFEILHAVVSCKWTLRSDRAQNARSEALNLIRNRKGQLPHIAVVTGEPLPSRISSLALGTGDIDCVYHFALPELVTAVESTGAEDSWEMLRMMIDGKRLKDISDLPLDLAT